MKTNKEIIEMVRRLPCRMFFQQKEFFSLNEWRINTALNILRKEILDEIDKIPYSTETAEVRSKEIKQIIKQKTEKELE